MLITAKDVERAYVRLAARQAPAYSDTDAAAAADRQAQPESDSFNPQVGDYRISRQPDENGVYWLWMFEIDGQWVFQRVLTAEQVAAWIADKAQVGETASFTYYRLWRAVARTGEGCQAAPMTLRAALAEAETWHAETPGALEENGHGYVFYSEDADAKSGRPWCYIPNITAPAAFYQITDAQLDTLVIYAKSAVWRPVSNLVL
jgi:hypothetical protein